MFTDPLEELCLRKHMQLRTVLKLALYNSGLHFTDADGIADDHQMKYRRGYSYLPSYVRSYIERELETAREIVEPAYA